MNTYIPPLSGCDAGYKTSISKPLELDEPIIAGNLNAHSLLWQDETAGGHEENNIASEIDLSNFVVLNEKASTRLMDSCKSFLAISGASSSIAVDIEVHGVCIRLGPFINSSVHSLWPHHNKTAWNFHQLP